MAEKDERRRYSLATAICLIMGICIGSGIFFKSDNVLVATGGSVGAGVAMFCLAASYIVFGGLCLTLFAARTDGAGGLVDYAERFVSPRFARLIALHYAFVYLPSISAVIFWVAGVYACMVLGLPPTLANQLGIGLALMLACSFVNALTPRVQAVARQANLVYEPDDIARAFDAPVYQFCVFVEPGEEGVFLDKTTSVAATRWTNLFCDVVPREGGKAFGVEATLARFGLGPEEAVAFGDGENDLSMFGAVGTSVAMGNAWDSVKERATHVTTGVDDDGIWNACRALGLI